MHPDWGIPHGFVFHSTDDCFNVFAAETKYNRYIDKCYVHIVVKKTGNKEVSIANAIDMLNDTG